MFSTNACGPYAFAAATVFAGVRDTKLEEKNENSNQTSGVVRGTNRVVASAAKVMPAARNQERRGRRGLGYASCGSCDGRIWNMYGWLRFDSLAFSAACSAGCAAGWRFCKATCIDDFWGIFFRRFAA
jgi:hypothetical protein